MAHFGYFATTTESLDLLRAFLHDGGVKALCVDRVLHVPHAPEHATWGPELEDCVRRHGVAYLTGSFTNWPLGFRPFDEGTHKGKFYFDPTHGGPVLGLLLSEDGAREHDTLLGPGELWFQSRYFNPESGKREPPSREVKEAFKSLVHLMRSRLERLELDGLETFVAPEAKRLYLSGHATIRWKGKDFHVPL